MNNRVIYKLIYLLIHSFYTIFEYAQCIIEWSQEKIVDFYHEFVSDRSTKYCLSDIYHSNKTPRHLTILLGQEEPSYEDLANIIIWSIAAGVTFISFYDYKEILQKNQDKLEYEVDKRKEKNDHVIWHNGTKSTYRNGFTGRKVHVKIWEDGKASFLNVTKSLLDCNSSKITIDTLNKSLYKDFEFPDPDLGFYCGRTLKLHNYPTWQIRVTEFLSIKSHHNITFRTFLEKLLIYSKCEQRLGK